MGNSYTQKVRKGEVNNMDIRREINEFLQLSSEENYEELKKKLGCDTCKKIGAILDILEIGESSIAHSKLILHICEDTLERCSLTMGTKTDAS